MACCSGSGGKETRIAESCLAPSAGSAVVSTKHKIGRETGKTGKIDGLVEGMNLEGTKEVVAHHVGPLSGQYGGIGQGLVGLMVE